MTGPHTPGSHKGHRLRARLTLTFDTAWRIGSGREGATSNLGVLLDHRDLPALPGSSLRGNLRATAERLAPALGMTACLLDGHASDVQCLGDVGNKRLRNELNDFSAALEAQAAREAQGTGMLSRKLLEWIMEHTCGVCRLFGSAQRAGRIFISDAALVLGANAERPRLGHRDGVVLDRDSRTARDGLKYDFEVSNPGLRYQTQIDITDPTDEDRALVAASLFEWLDGFSIGGFTARGLGRAHATLDALEEVDFNQLHQRRAWLLKRQWTPLPNPEETLTRWIDAQLPPAPSAQGA